ncbi:hypothetical protein Acr_00g0089540 [Actinidia rufa]|uniref:Uncharacterized protein n=1 Tax=Actinidia rufa TaxID=165716 RepID=A0A7J0DYI3_9ERIC|nr:hypothetical protein Acr_00g0089540 [Actinidia rufa]
MTDKVNQPPPPPSPKESSPREKLSEIEVPSSPTTELNIMTQGDLDHLRETCCFPLGVQIRIPGNGETILSADDGEVSFYEAAFPTGLGSESGWLYFKARPSKNILKGPPAMTRDGRRDSSSSREIIGSSILAFVAKKGPYGFRGHRALRVPALSETEDERFRRVFEKIGEGGTSRFRWGETTTSAGDASESSHSKDVPHPKVPSRYDSVELIGIIRKAMKRIIPHLTPLITAMSKRIKLSQLAKDVAEKTATSSSKGVVIFEFFETASKKRALDDGKGSTAKSVPSKAPGLHALVMANATMAEEILAGVILPADKEKVEKLTFDQHGVILGSSFAVHSRDFAESANNHRALTESSEHEMFMSSRINLGDGELEHYLPSWVSDHLGGKSYITNEVNQSSSSPFKGSPTDNSFVYTEHSKMDTLNLTKETSVMSQGDQDKLREKYSFPSEIQLKIPRVGKSCNRLPVLTENEVQRTAEVLGKIEPGGYFDVSKVLDSKIFKRHFARGRIKVSSSGRKNNTLGDERESCLSRGDLQCGSPSRSNSVEYLGVIRGDIGRIARKAFSDSPDLTFPRWLGGKVQDPFSNLFLRGSSFSSDSRSESLSDSGLSPELRSDAMSSQINLSTLTKRRERKAATKDASSVAMSQPPFKGIVIQDKRHQEKAHIEVEFSKGKEAMPPPQPKRTKSNKGASNTAVHASVPGCPSTLSGENLGPRALMMSSALVAQKILNGVIFPADKEKVDQFTMDKLVIMLVSALALRSQDHPNDYHFQLARANSAELKMAKKTKAELKTNSEATTQLEAEVTKLTSKLALAKKLAIEEFKSLDNFKEAVTDSAATYFSEGIEFCKRQLLHQHPNLGVDVDADFAKEEEEAKAGKKEEETKAKPTPLIDFNFLGG